MNMMSYHCISNPMEEHRTETSWSECFQDLASWCHLPQDELAQTNVTNQSEYKDSFDDQSMYYWEGNLSSLDLKGESNQLSLQYPPEEDNKNSLTPLMSGNQDAKDAAIRYSCNMVLTPGIDQGIDSRQNEIKTINWNDMAPLTPHYSTPLTIISTKRQNIPPKQEVVAENKPKPSLKLDINAACTRAPLPATSDLTVTRPVNTPEVLNSILEVEDSSAFNLFSFIEGCDDQTMMAVDPNSIVSQRPKETLATLSQKVIKIDHDYTTETPPASEPLTLKNVSAFSLGFKDFSMIPEEDNDCKPRVKEEPSSPSPSTSTSLGKRARRAMEDEDYIYEEEASSDNSTDWSPIARKKPKYNKKKNSEGPRTRTSSFSDSGSVTSGPDKYRELRDRNNEASRRSRMNRKQKEVEMSDRANALQRDNEVLRVKAESLEKRVKTLRRVLLQKVQKAALQARERN